MTPAEPTADQLRRDPLPLLGRVAVVTGVSRRAGIGYAIARRLAALGASLFLHHYAPHDRDQPWGSIRRPEAVIAGVTEALAGASPSVRHQEPTSHSTYPTPRRVWISRGSLVSTLRRSTDT